MVYTAIKIDVDWLPPEEALNWADEKLEIINKVLTDKGYKVVRSTYKLTGRGIHFIAVVEGELKPEELLKLQWLLGDDPTRCEINYRRLKRGTFPQRNILFDKVVWRKPPTEKCLKCKLWRLYQEEIKERKPPAYKAVFKVNNEELLTKLITVLGEIFNRDPTFFYEIEGYEVKIFAKDKDTAIKRGLWLKHKVLNGKINFELEPVLENDIIEDED